MGLGVGTIFALSAKAKYNDSLPQCASTDKNRCTELGTSQRDSARSAGNVATVAMGFGGAALVTGAVLFFTAPSQKEAPREGARVEVVPTLGGALVRGTF